MRERIVWFIKVFDSANPSVFGLGECAPLPGLSSELTESFEQNLRQHLHAFSKLSLQEAISKLKEEHTRLPSSVVMALEMAFADLENKGERQYFPGEFERGKTIDINGLIWMADMDLMLQQIAIKIYDGFTCIKMKVGSLNFEKECDVISYIRRKYYRESITIRLDANGAFKPDDVLYKLNELAKYNIHSIEQPVKSGQVELMKEVIRHSPIPIALDEELIGIYHDQQKEALLTELNPHYIILKPSLHGGFIGSEEWITIAEKKNIGWWMTSALESNVGLYAIAQFTANKKITLPQGLGTGKLYDNNIPGPLLVEKGILKSFPQQPWNFDDLTFQPS
ncbi:MAG: o-succinylbenzoate synthase [Chryseotalea sp.]